MRDACVPVVFLNLHVRKTTLTRPVEEVEDLLQFVQTAGLRGRDFGVVRWGRLHCCRLGLTQGMINLPKKLLILNLLAHRLWLSWRLYTLIYGTPSILWLTLIISSAWLTQELGFTRALRRHSRTWIGINWLLLYNMLDYSFRLHINFIWNVFKACIIW